MAEGGGKRTNRPTRYIAEKKVTAFTKREVNPLKSREWGEEGQESGKRITTGRDLGKTIVGSSTRSGGDRKENKLMGGKKKKREVQLEAF